MIELIFVVVIIGILAAVAIPKFAVTSSEARNTKGKSTLAAVRNSIATERQKRILRGDFTAITDLSVGGLFKGFSADRSGVSHEILSYPPKECVGESKGCWTGSGTSYTFKPAGAHSNCDFTLANNKLTTSSCDALDL